MGMLKRALFTMITTAVAVAGLASVASAETKTFQGTGWGTTETSAIRNAEDQAILSATLSGYFSTQCVREGFPWTTQLGPEKWSANAWVRCTRPDTPPPTGTGDPIVGVHSGKCVAVRGGSSANGTRVQLFSCDGTASQKWTFASDGTLRALGKCLDVSGYGTTNGSVVQLYACHGGGNQIWERYGDRALRNPVSGRCLDALGFNTAEGANLGLWDCNGAANQQWNYVA